MAESVKWNLLAAIASGNISKQDELEIDRLMSADPAFAEEVQKAKDLYVASANTLGVSFDAEQGLKKLHESIDQQNVVVMQAQPRKKIGAVVKWLAAACLIAMVSIWWYRLQTPAMPAEIQYVTISAGTGAEHKKVSLPDGSNVYLNGKTTIKYPVAFELGQRKVYLDGDAFFDVTKDPQRPFIVEANGVSTTVLGTSFRIRHDDASDKIEVMVATGKVAVKKDTSMLGLLTPGEGVEYNTKTSQLIRRQYPTAEITSMVQQTLHFNNTSFADVANELEKWYGVKVILQNEQLHNYRFSGEFRNAGLHAILESMAISSSIRYQQQADTVYIRNK
jgi:transmembrane sensor